jgi:hypothetical protein
VPTSITSFDLCCRSAKKKKTELEAAARKIFQANDKIETDRRKMLENESQMVQIPTSLSITCLKFKYSSSFSQPIIVSETEPKFGLQGEQVRAKTREIVEVHKREATRQEKILVASRELELAEAELSNLPDYEPPTQEIVSFLCFFGALYLHLERYQLDLEAEDIHLFTYIHMGVGVKFLFDYRVLKVRTALCLSVIPNHWLYWLH